MKTVPTMLASLRAPRAVLLATAASACVSAGCATTTSERTLTPPNVIVAPYDGTQEVLWAVVPLRNESGTTLIDGYEVTDQIILAIEEARGLRSVPLNRVIETMRALKMQSVRSPADALKLAEALGADGVLVGSVTAYDPYNPPKLGIALALYGRTGAMAGHAADSPDPRVIATSPSEYKPFPGSQFAERPLSVASEVLDAANHQVLMDVRTYAQGRHDDRSALSWEVYLASMERYTRFAAHHMVDRLVQQEWLRLTKQAGSQAQPPH